MIQIFTKLKDSFNATSKIVETTWFNGLGQFPLLLHFLEFHYSEVEFKIELDYRTSDFKRKNDALDNVGDILINRIYSKKYSTSKVDNFVIRRSNMLERFFLKKGQVIISSKNLEVIECISEMTGIDSYFSKPDILISELKSLYEDGYILLRTEFSSSTNIELDKYLEVIVLMAQICNSLADRKF